MKLCMDSIPFLVCDDPKHHYIEYGISKNLVIEPSQINSSAIDKMKEYKSNNIYAEMQKYFTESGNIMTKYKKAFWQIGII